MGVVNDLLELVGVELAITILVDVEAQLFRTAHSKLQHTSIIAMQRAHLITAD